jgi:hypothetical protein
MFKNRFILVVAVLSILMVTVAISRPFSNTPAHLTASSIGSSAFYEYRRGEWSPNTVAAASIGGAAFYQYRQGEWSVNLNGANREAALQDFRQGERTASLTPDLRDYSNHLYRQGEWFGK